MSQTKICCKTCSGFEVHCERNSHKITERICGELNRYYVLEISYSNMGTTRNIFFHRSKTQEYNYVFNVFETHSREEERKKYHENTGIFEEKAICFLCSRNQPASNKQQ